MFSKAFKTLAAATALSAAMTLAAHAESVLRIRDVGDMAISPDGGFTEIAAGVASATLLGKVRVDRFDDGGQGAIVRHGAR